MHVTPSQHLFEALCPRLEEGEQEVWFRHPELPLQTNQLGCIVFDEDVQYVTNQRDQYYLLLSQKNRIFLGSRARLVMECYLQRDLTGMQFQPKDPNPYNLCPENLVVFGHRSKDIMPLIWAKQMFLNRTIEYMNSRTAILLKRGVDPVQYWKLMALPKYYFNKWVEQSEFQKPEGKKRGSYSVGTRRMETIAIIKQMKAEKRSNEDIKQVLGIKNKSGLSYWLRIIRAENDI